MNQRGNIYVGIVLALGVSLVLSGGAWLAYKRGDKNGSDRVQAVMDKENLRRSQDALNAIKETRAKEQTLQDAADAQRKARDAKIQTLNRDLVTAIEQLRNRPERPATADVPATASSGPSGAGCTGSGLYKPDADFLTREAARAKRLGIALAQCQSQYEAARAVK